MPEGMPAYQFAPRPRDKRVQSEKNFMRCIERIYQANTKPADPGNPLDPSGLESGRNSACVWHHLITWIQKRVAERLAIGSRTMLRLEGTMKKGCGGRYKERTAKRRIREEVSSMNAMLPRKHGTQLGHNQAPQPSDDGLRGRI